MPKSRTFNSSSVASIYEPIYTPNTTDPGNHENVCLVGQCGTPYATGATKTVDDNLMGMNPEGVDPANNPGNYFGMLPDSELHADCALYDASCTGDKTSARNDFFTRLLPDLETNPCFNMRFGTGNGTKDCQKIESPERLEEMEEIKSWMRSPQCKTASAAWNAEYGGVRANLSSYDTENCCGECELTSGTVDIYYFPEANASTDCLSVVGDYVNPLTYGATVDTANGYQNFEVNGVATSSHLTYWGCTTYTGAGPPSILTTAAISQLGDVTFKASYVNPWSPVSCIGSAASSPSPNIAPRATIRARAHPLVARNATKQDGGSPGSTVILDGYTL